MTYALFLGCTIPSTLVGYGTATRTVLAHFGVGLVDLPFTCCGAPARRFSREGFAIAAARNLALAERAGLDVLTPCTCCYGTLRHAARFLQEDDRLRARARDALAAERLVWSGTSRVEHLLGVLVRDVGVERIARAVRAPGARLRVAAQYGCHALRPSEVTGLDNPAAPTMFEALLRAAGAVPVDWPRRLDCCGDPLHDANAPLASQMAYAKLVDAQAAGAEAVCSACPHCHLRFGTTQAAYGGPALRSLVYPQLLGLAMGLPAHALGL